MSGVRLDLGCRWLFTLKPFDKTQPLRSGCMILNFPELLPPARIVNGRMSIAPSSAIDLKPMTAILVMPSCFFVALFVLPHFFDFGHYSLPRTTA